MSDSTYEQDQQSSSKGQGGAEEPPAEQSASTGGVGSEDSANPGTRTGKPDSADGTALNLSDEDLPEAQSESGI